MENRNEQTRNTLYTDERITIQSAGSFIESLRLPFTSAARAHLEKLVEQECLSLAAAYRSREHERLHGAAAEREGAAAARDDAARRLAEAETERREVERGPAPGLVKILLCAFCALACFAAEFALTWQALTFVLNVEKYSALGILLGLAPPTALAVLELVVLRLIEAPWRSLRAAAAAPWRRAVTVGAMLVFLAGLGGGNLYTILLLAEAREEAARAQYNLSLEEGADAVEVNQTAIDRAILAVSVCVTLDGAIFLLLAFEEGRGFAERRRARRRAERLRKHHLGAVTALLAAESKLSTVRKSMETMEAEAQVLAERLRRQYLFDVEQQLNKLRCETPTEQLIELGLRGRAA